MKKLLSIILVLTMCLSLFTACKNDEQQEQTSLAAAAEYLFTMYKDVSPATYSTDYQVVSIVKIGTETFQIAWTASVGEEFVKIVPGESLTTIDVNNEVREDVAYTLTATLKDADGNTATVNFERNTPGVIIIDDTLTQAELVEIAYSLEVGVKLDQEATLTGVIKSIDTEWSDQYQNITVTFIVGGDEEHPIQAFRLKGEGAEGLAVGDTITVTGYFLNYNGKIEFDAGCTLDEVVKAEGGEEGGNEDENAGNEGNTGNGGSTGSGDANNGGSNNGGSTNTGSNYTTAAEIIAAAYALADGESLDKAYTLTGVISAINNPFSSYGDITVTIIVGGDTAHPIMCYQMVGDGAEDLIVGDTITVTGTLTNYKGTIEFAKKCTLDSVEKTGVAQEIPTDPAEIMADIEALEDGETLSYKPTLVGTVLEVSEVSSYGDVNVTIEVEGTNGKTIYCYGVKGDGNTEIKVGDKIKVTGTVKNYKGTLEFYLPTFEYAE